MKYTQEQKIENIEKVSKLVGGGHYFYTDANLIDLFPKLEEQGDNTISNSKYILCNYKHTGMYFGNNGCIAKYDTYVSPEQIYKTLGIKQEEQTMNEFPKLEIGKHLLLVNVAYEDTPTKRYAIYMGDYIAYTEEDKKLSGWDHLNSIDVEEVYEIENIVYALLRKDLVWKKPLQNLESK